MIELVARSPLLGSATLPQVGHGAPRTAMLTVAAPKAGKIATTTPTLVMVHALTTTEASDFTTEPQAHGHRTAAAVATETATDADVNYFDQRALRFGRDGCRCPSG
jgi:hypothetical protein